MFRYTIEELKGKSDLEMLRAIITERKESCTNMYSPLSKRLDNLYNKIDIKIRNGKKNI